MGFQQKRTQETGVEEDHAGGARATHRESTVHYVLNTTAAQLGNACGGRRVDEAIQKGMAGCSPTH